MTLDDLFGILTTFLSSGEFSNVNLRIEKRANEVGVFIRLFPTTPNERSDRKKTSNQSDQPRVKEEADDPVDCQEPPDLVHLSDSVDQSESVDQSDFDEPLIRGLEKKAVNEGPLLSGNLDEPQTRASDVRIKEEILDEFIAGIDDGGLSSEFCCHSTTNCKVWNAETSVATDESKAADGMGCESSFDIATNDNVQEAETSVNTVVVDDKSSNDSKVTDDIRDISGNNQVLIPSDGSTRRSLRRSSSKVRNAPKLRKSRRCVPCQLVFSDLEYRKHYISHHYSDNKNRAKFSCFLCGSKFVRPCGVRLHFKSSHDLEFDCKLCIIGFSGREEMLAHRRAFHPEPNSDASIEEEEGDCTCADCGRELATRNLLGYHRHLHAEQPEYLTKWTRKEAKRTVACTHCPTKFAFPRLFLKHYLKTHVPNSDRKSGVLPCPHCGKALDSEEDLLRHARTFHWVREKKTMEETAKPDEELSSITGAILAAPPPRKSAPSRCRSCDLTFSSEANFRHHYHEFHSYPRAMLKRAILCPVCDQQFLSIKDRNTHRKVAHGGGKYRFKCSYCDYVDKGQSYVTKHEKRVHGDREFECVLCKFKFRHESDLTKHFDRIHRKNYRFQCSVCQKKFYRRGELEIHGRTQHRFGCESCEMRFSTNAHLVEHWKEAHGADYCDDPADLDRVARDKAVPKCPICLKSFFDECTRRKHGESPHSFACEDCPLKFTRTMALLEHCRDVHRGRELSGNR